MDINQKEIDRLFKLIDKQLNNNEKVLNYHSAKELEEKLDLTLPVAPQSMEEVFKSLEQYLKYCQNTLSPQFNNQLYAGVSTPSLYGEIVSYITNTSMATFEIAPIATLIEKELVKKLNSLVGFGGQEGIMCTGGSNANMLALHCARNQNDPQAYFEGNKKDYVVFISENAHYSFEKAVNLMGLGLNSLMSVQTDDEGRMLPHDLENCILKALEDKKNPLMISSTMGTTVMGAFDPIEEIDTVAKKYSIWHHCDGAWGGSALLTDKMRELTRGVHKVDSFTWDAHKLMDVGLITSFFLSKHSGILRKSNATRGGEKYIFHEYENKAYDLGPLSLQCGRKVDSLRLWLNWIHLGDSGYKKHIDDLLERKEYFVKRLKREEGVFRILHNPAFLNVCFQILPKNKDEDINKFNFKKRYELVRKGEFQVNFSKNAKGDIFFRHIFANARTKLSDIDRLVDELINIR